MNFYPFHIGDYVSHTAHLEPMEDLDAAMNTFAKLAGEVRGGTA